jgi:hypothetical protein
MKNLILATVTTLMIVSCKVQEHSCHTTEVEPTLYSYESDTTTYNDSITFNVTVNVLDSLPVDTICYNKFYIVDTKSDIEMKVNVPCKRDFYEWYDKDTYLILDTLEYHPIK